VEQHQTPDPGKKDWVLSTRVSKVGRQRHKLKSLQKGRSSMTFDLNEYYITPPSLAGHLGENYPLGDVLGHGTFGKVFAREDKRTGVHCAVKVISKAKWQQPEVRALMATELEMMIITGDHPLIGGVVEFFETASELQIVSPLLGAQDREPSSTLFEPRFHASFSPF